MIDTGKRFCALTAIFERPLPDNLPPDVYG